MKISCCRISALVLVGMLASSLGCPTPRSNDPVADDSKTGKVNSDGLQKDDAAPTQDPSILAGSFDRVTQLLAAGKVDEAAALNQSLLIADPTSQQATFLAAQILAAQGSFRDATEVLDSISAQLPTQQWEATELQMAHWLMLDNDFIGAERRLKKALRRDQNSHGIRHLLAAMLNRMGRRHEASDHLHLLCRIGQVSEWELRSLLVVSESYGRWLEDGHSHPENMQLIGLINDARKWWFGQERRIALEITERTLADKSVIDWNNYPEIRAFYGRQLFELQQLEKAAKWLAGTDQSLHRYSDYWVAMGIRSTLEGENSEAVRCFAEAIGRDPTDYEAFHLYLQALRAVGETETADAVVEIRQLVLEAGQMGLKVGGQGKEDEHNVEQVASILMRLERPYEALMWLQLAAERYSMGDEVLRTLAERRALLQTRQPKSAAGVFALGGLATDKFPLPEIAPEEVAKIQTSIASQAALPLPAIVPAQFGNIAMEVGIDQPYFNAIKRVEKFTLIFQQLGAGVACTDFDHDGLVDLYFGQGAGNPPDMPGTLPNRMYRNLGDRFVNTTDATRTDDRGYTTGVTTGDWNQDGFADLVVGNLGVNRLLINQGDGTFIDAMHDSMWDVGKFTASVAIADVTGDALPDIFEVNYNDDPKIFDPLVFNAEGVPASLPGPLKFDAAFDRVFVNTGEGMQGMTMDQDNTEPGTGLGLVITDVDGAPGNEIFVANDMRANQLWQLNRQKASLESSAPSDAAHQPAFVERAIVQGCAFDRLGQPNACMGIATADFDQDGRIDFHVTNLDNESVNLFRQGSQGQFIDAAPRFQLDQPSWNLVGFGTQALDYDNNTLIDLIVGNGHIDDFRHEGKRHKMPLQLFAGRRTHFEVTPVTDSSGYFGDEHLSRAVATCDWNRDGKVDVAIVDLAGPAALLENRTETPFHWLQIALVGTQSERDAIGTSVVVTTGDQKLLQVVTAGDGYLCKNEPILRFGLGDAESIEQINIRWPSGKQQSLQNVKADQRVLIVEGDNHDQVWTDEL